ncbi:MAG TPA: FhaA domain-containing protein [Candidatus Limnocylindrales bacterium]
MAAVADLERLLERVFERTTARLFKAGVQVVQVERRVERAMERARSQDGTRVSVPARYRVRLHPLDLTDASARAGGASELAAHLAQSALAFARSHGYHLAGRPEVWLVADPAVERGQVEVDVVGKGVGAAGPPPVAGPPLPAADWPPPAAEASPAAASPSGDPIAGARPSTAAASPGAVPAAGATLPPVAARAAPPPVVAPVDAPPAASPPAGLAASAAIGGQVEGGEAYAAGIRGDGSQTLVFRRPVPLAARAVLRVCAADGRERTIEVDGTPLTIGRSQDNALVLGDRRVSRHHGRLQARRGTLLYTDLGSTNGSRVNGIRVDEIVLGEGDRLQVGDTVLVVEMLPG